MEVNSTMLQVPVIKEEVVENEFSIDPLSASLFNVQAPCFEEHLERMSQVPEVEIKTEPVHVSVDDTSVVGLKVEEHICDNFETFPDLSGDCSQMFDAFNEKSEEPQTNQILPDKQPSQKKRKQKTTPSAEKSKKKNTSKTRPSDEKNKKKNTAKRARKVKPQKISESVTEKNSNKRKTVKQSTVRAKRTKANADAIISKPRASNNSGRKRKASTKKTMIQTQIEGETATSINDKKNDDMTKTKTTGSEDSSNKEQNDITKERKVIIQCECGKQFQSKGALSKHRKIHSDERPFQCLYCARPFLRKSDLQRHERIHTGEKPFQCEICGKEFRLKNHLQLHENHHLGNKKYSCQYCGKCFVQKGQCIIHESTHDENPVDRPIFLCQFCGKPFLYKKGLHWHEKAHKKIEMEKHPCKICGRGFRAMQDLLRHELTHLPKEDKPFKCQYCDKTYCQRDPLLEHERKHTGVKVHKCSQCSESFVTRNTLYHHIKVKHNPDKAKIQCNVCGKYFYDKYYANLHERAHFGEKPEHCMHCGKGFLRKPTRTHHEKNCKIRADKNAGKELPQCRFCDRKFQNEVKRDRHEKKGTCSYINTIN